MAPLAVQEIAMALWLIAKGFSQVEPEARSRTGSA
jgi:hypothetical protein